MADRAARLAGDLGRSHRSRIAGAGDGLILRGGGRAFGVWSGASAGVAVLGPMLGGLLVDALSWRAVFLIHVPPVLLALLLTRRFVGGRRGAPPSGSPGFPRPGLTAVAIAWMAVGADFGPP